MEADIQMNMYRGDFGSARMKDILSAHTKYRKLLIILAAMILALTLAS